MSQAGLLEVPASYRGVSWLFSCSESVVAKWLLLRKANANEGSRVCNLLSLVSCPKHVHFTSLTLVAKY
jgi:hypothetical protein